MNTIYVEVRCDDEVVNRTTQNLSHRPSLAALQFRLIMVNLKFHNCINTICGRLEDAEQNIVMQKTLTNRQKTLPRKCEIAL